MTKSPAERLGPLTVRARAQAAEFVAREQDVRDRLDEGIHAMRVATRRLRSELRTYRSAFEPGSTDHLRTELKWFSDLLGAARDAQVIAARIGHFERISRPAGGQEKAALRSALDAPRYNALVAELATFAISPPFAPSSKGRRWLVRRLRREIARTVAAVKRAKALDGPARDTALHDVRKAAKRVRYAAETVEPAFGKRARRIARVFEAVQTSLGEYHDATVTKEMLRLEQEWGRGDVLDFDEVVAREERRAVDALAAFGEDWARTKRTLGRHWPTG
jgi:CHAD domain-containing protein